MLATLVAASFLAAGCPPAARDPADAPPSAAEVRRMRDVVREMDPEVRAAIRRVVSEMRPRD